MKEFENITNLKSVLKDSDSGEMFFNSNLNKNQIYRFYSKGFFDHLLLGFDSDNYTLVGLRILPNKPINKWPLVYFYRGGNSVMECPNLESIVPFLLKFSIECQDTFVVYNKDIENVKKYYKPIFEALDTPEAYQYFIDYILNQDNKPKEIDDYEDIYKKLGRDAREYVRVTRDFDTSEGYQVFLDVVRQIERNEKVVPEIASKDYGAWTTRIYKPLGLEAWDDDLKTSIENRVLCIWRSFIEPHSYDPISTSPPSVFSHDSTDTGHFNSKILDGIHSYKDEFPQELKEHPLFDVAMGMRQEGYSATLGFATAAAVIDEQYNDPLLSWKSLVNAGFYTKDNRQHTLLPQQAIALCERNDWTDAAQALTQNLEVYKSIGKEGIQ